MKDKNSLAHSAWNCKYHIVFAPKYRRMEIYGKIRKDIGVIIITTSFTGGYDWKIFFEIAIINISVLKYWYK